MASSEGQTLFYKKEKETSGQIRPPVLSGLSDLRDEREILE